MTVLFSEPCSHLDRNGDGFISVDEVATLMEELGVETDRVAGALPEGTPEASPKLLSESAAQPDSEKKLLDGLADKPQSGVNLSEFVHFNHQVRMMNPILLLYSLLHEPFT